MKLELGQKIIVSSKLKRRAFFKRKDDNIFNQRCKEWIEESIPTTECVVVGIRTLQNGVTDWDSEAGNVFMPKETFRAVMVANSLYRKPFFTKISNL